jgi:hypothetical protein
VRPNNGLTNLICRSTINTFNLFCCPEVVLILKSYSAENLRMTVM